MIDLAEIALDEGTRASGGGIDPADLLEGEALARTLAAPPLPVASLT
jgi:hypothetical protein